MTAHTGDIQSALSQILNENDARAALGFCKTLHDVLSGTSLSTLPQNETIPPTLSIVLPVYNEEENVSPLLKRITEVLAKISVSYEIIFVNDGSTDHSQSRLEQLAKEDSHVIVIEFARNFGHQTAISAGMEHSRGRAVICMDADMQDSPEAISELVTKWEEGYQVVYGLRVKRKESFLKRSAYALFYRLLRLIADIKIPLDAGDFCIMDRKVVDLINAMPERNRFLRGIRSWVGFAQIGIPIERHARDSGRTKYTIHRLISLALDGLISFSVKPLRLITFFGIILSICSVLLAIFYTLKKITVGLTPPGFATIVVFLSFFSGIQLITIGIIGEYVGRIFEETKRRPLYIVRKIVSSKP